MTDPGRAAHFRPCRRRCYAHCCRGRCLAHDFSRPAGEGSAGDSAYTAVLYTLSPCSHPAGEGTLNAVLAFQASVRLPETGVVDRPTWTALLGEQEAGRLYAAAGAGSAAGGDGAGAGAGAAGAGAGAVRAGDVGESHAARTGVSDVETFERWPVLMEGDGGRAVHALQVRRVGRVGRGGRGRVGCCGPVGRDALSSLRVATGGVGWSGMDG